MSEYEDELFEPTEVLRFESANEKFKLIMIPFDIEKN